MEKSNANTCHLYSLNMMLLLNLRQRFAKDPFLRDAAHLYFLFW